MIKSKFLLDIVDLLLDGDDGDIEIRPQMDYLSEDEYEYTGSGLFVTFTHSDGIFQHKTANQNLILGGVKFASSEFPVEGEATLFFKNGIIDFLEIWCYTGPFPETELTKYTLTQSWNGSPGKLLSTEF